MAARPLAVDAPLGLDHLVVEAEALVVQQVAELRGLRPQVGAVVVPRGVLDWNLVGDAEAVALQADDLLRIVGQQTDRAETEVHQDLRARSRSHAGRRVAPAGGWRPPCRDPPPGAGRP